jgi:hypothetical protein
MPFSIDILGDEVRRDFNDMIPFEDTRYLAAARHAIPPYFVDKPANPLFWDQLRPLPREMV